MPATPINGPHILISGTMPCTSCQSSRSFIALFQLHEVPRCRENADQIMSLADLYITSNDGCRRCTLILEAIKKWTPIRCQDAFYLEAPEQNVIGINNKMSSSLLPWEEFRYGYASILDIFLCKRTCWMGNSPTMEERSHHTTMFGLYTESIETSEVLGIPFASRVPAFASAEACSVQIKQWLDRCLGDHIDSCSSAVADLPSRVIAVGSHYQQPRLHITRPGDRGSYCALSYCWGGSVAFKTEIASYEDRKTGFDIDLLPQTIKHAVLLARELDIPYLWVDSICIIQNSVSDWECEAARMCDIYSQAVVVFAAVDAPDSDTGLFYEDPRRQYLSVGADHEAVFVRQDFHKEATDSLSDQVSEQLKVDELHKRGWTLQEVALASRTVWFRSSEVSWSCARSTACECTPVLKDIVYNRPSHLERRLQTIAYLRNIKANYSQWLDMWHVAIVDYFDRELSDVRDRLPAIAGLAAAVQSHVNRRYLFGLWEDDTLLDRLLWACWDKPKCEGPWDPRVFPSSDYAPTWSWASCSKDSSQDWHSTTNRNDTRVWQLKDVRINLSTSNRFGSGRGVLQLYSLIVPVSRDPHGDYLVSTKDIRASDSGNEMSSSATIRVAWNAAHGFWKKDCRVDYVDIQQWYENRQLYFIFSTIRLENGKTTWFQGLVLEQLHGTEEDLRKFRRLGYIFDRFAEPSEAQDDTLCNHVSDSEPDGNHTDSESDGSDTDSKPGRLDTAFERERRFIRPTWKNWQKMGTWDTIALV